MITGSVHLFLTEIRENVLRCAFSWHHIFLYGINVFFSLNGNSACTAEYEFNSVTKRLYNIPFLIQNEKNYLPNILKTKYFSYHISNKSFIVLRREYNSCNKIKETPFLKSYGGKFREDKWRALRTKRIRHLVVFPFLWTFYFLCCIVC